jgi:hypothetical protein
LWRGRRWRNEKKKSTYHFLVVFFLSFFFPLPYTFISLFIFSFVFLFFFFFLLPLAAEHVRVELTWLCPGNIAAAARMTYPSAAENVSNVLKSVIHPTDEGILFLSYGIQDCR